MSPLPSTSPANTIRALSSGAAAQLSFELTGFTADLNPPHGGDRAARRVRRDGHERRPTSGGHGWVGGRLGPVYSVVTTKGARLVQGGGCLTVSVAGLVLGGGFGS